MLFADRLEVWNPGALPPSLALEKLRHPHGSVPFNPQLAGALYLTKYNNLRDHMTTIWN
jgi:predicted HTH transcriptional regulator